MIFDLTSATLEEIHGGWQISPSTPSLASRTASSTLTKGFRDNLYYSFARNPNVIQNLPGQSVFGAVIMNWCRAYTPCSKQSCTNWIWQDKMYPGARCRKCSNMWPTTSTSTGKGKGFGKPNNRTTRGHQGLDPPPGLGKVRPLKISKVQQEATELSSTTWTSFTEDIQSKLQAIGIGPSKPEAPELKDVLKTHMEALPQQVQELVTKLTTPEPNHALKGRLRPSSKEESLTSRTCR